MEIFMEENLVKEYTARIVQSSPTELVVITYELILSEIKKGKEFYQLGDQDSFVKNLKRAQRFLAHMMESLDYQYRISYDLLGLYLYINKKLVDGICKLEPEALKNIESVINKLKAGFEEISKDDQTGPVMMNTQQLYAGLTYGKEKLNEVYLHPEEEKRGYRV